jgi:hypothetical protein
LLSYGGE